MWVSKDEVAHYAGVVWEVLCTFGLLFEDCLVLSNIRKQKIIIFTCMKKTINTKGTERGSPDSRLKWYESFLRRTYDMSWLFPQIYRKHNI